MVKLQCVVATLQLFGLIFLLYCAYRSWKHVPRVTINRIENDEDGWIPIERFDEFKREDYEYFLVTDGVKVDTCFALDYNKEGKPIFNKYWDRSFITHWRPLPEPPGKKNG